MSIRESLDFERAYSYQLTVQATDGGEPPLSNHATVNVTVTDINDNQPIFLQNSYSVIVNEAADLRQELIQVLVGTGCISVLWFFLYSSVFQCCFSSFIKLRGVNCQIFWGQTVCRS